MGIKQSKMYPETVTFENPMTSKNEEQAEVTVTRAVMDRIRQVHERQNNPPQSGIHQEKSPENVKCLNANNNRPLIQHGNNYLACDNYRQNCESNNSKRNTKEPTEEKRPPPPSFLDRDESNNNWQHHIDSVSNGQVQLEKQITQLKDRAEHRKRPAKCHFLQTKLIECYKQNITHTLTCAHEVREFNQCLREHCKRILDDDEQAML